MEMRRTSCQERGLRVGTLATVLKHHDIPANSLVKVVADEDDDAPAVEVLIAAGPIHEEPVDEVYGEYILDRAGDARNTDPARLFTLDPGIERGKLYYWVDVNCMTPITDDGADNE